MMVIEYTELFHTFTPSNVLLLWLKYANSTQKLCALLYI